jgi:hypothetical protein
MVVVPTRLFLRDVTSALAPSNGTKSAVLPVVAATSNSGAGYEDLSLLGTKGALQVTRSITADVNTNHQDQYIARFTSPPLADGVIPAQTWRLGIAMSEGDAAADSYLVISLYVWRPGTSSVVGYIRDSDSPLGVEWSATEDGQVVQFSGLAVTGQEDDVVVLEAWRHKAAA